MSRSLRLTEQDLRALQHRRAVTKPRKYRNSPITDGAGRHDSKKEAQRYQDLLVLERAGRIANVRRQVPYAIVIDGEHVCTYTADFTYREGARLVVEDVKSPPTRKNPLYRLKRALMRSLHKIDITEL